MKKIVLAGGCFWGVEAYFKRVNGILATKYQAMPMEKLKRLIIRKSVKGKTGM